MGILFMKVFNSDIMGLFLYKGAILLVWKCPYENKIYVLYMPILYNQYPFIWRYNLYIEEVHIETGPN